MRSVRRLNRVLFLNQPLLTMSSFTAFLCCWLLVSLAEAGTGPYSLSARPALADHTTQVWWQDGACHFQSPVHSVFVAEKGRNRTLVGKTEGVQIWIRNQKYFTNYTITLEPGAPCPPEKLSIDYFTGPGTPEPAEALIVETNNTFVSVAVKLPENREYLDDFSLKFEASMHVVTWSKNAVALKIVDNWFNFTLPTKLVPNTHYVARFSSIWAYEGRNYPSTPIRTEFDTAFYGLPVPKDFNETANSTAVTIGWKLDESVLTEPLPAHIAFSFFDVSLFCSDGSSRDDGPVEPEVTFTDLTPGVSCRMKVIPVYRLKRNRFGDISNTEAVHEFRAPFRSASNLAAISSESADGFVDIELSWKHSSCGGLYKVFTSVNGEEERLAATTGSNSVILRSYEFYSNYSITLKEDQPCSSASPSVEILTGVGKPHKVQDFAVKVQGTSVSLDILEASTMPREPDTYVITLENLGKITSYNQLRDASKVTDRRFTFTLKDCIHPENHYRVGVSPVISLGGRKLQGEPLFKLFDTVEW